MNNRVGRLAATFYTNFFSLVLIYGRRPWKEDDFWWKTTFDGIWPLIEDDLKNENKFKDKDDLNILVLRQKVWIVVWKVAAPYLLYHTIIQLYSYTVTRLPSTWALQPTCLSAASTAHTRQPEYKEGQHTIATCQILINTLDTSLKITQFSIKYDDRAHLSG